MSYPLIRDMPMEPNKHPMHALRIAFEALYPDESFRRLISSSNNRESVTGSYHVDRSLASIRLYDYCVQHKLEGVTKYGKPAIGRIKTNWLSKLMQEVRS